MILTASTDQETSNLSWAKRTIQLKFEIGEIPLFSIEFPAWVLDIHFTKLSGDFTGARPTIAPPVSSRDVMVIRSHPIHGRLQRFTLLADSYRYVPAQYCRYYVDLAGSFEGYLKKFSSKSRSTLLRKVRKFAKLSGGQICWRAFSRHEEMAEFHQLARQVSTKTYQQKLLGLGIPGADDFVEELLELAHQDRIRGYILFFQNQPIGYLCCPVQDGVLIYQYLGYDPEFQHLSPGTVLQYLVFERLFQESRFKIFDFTEGEGDHKAFFSTGSTLCADVYYYPRLARNFTFLMLHAALQQASNCAANTLERVGLKGPIKRFVRSKLGLFGSVPRDFGAKVEKSSVVMR